MGQRRTIELKFVGGLDERVSKKILPDGLLRELHDQRMDQLGRIVRRPGRYAAGSDADVAGSDAIPRVVFAQGASVSMLTPRRQFTRSTGGVWSSDGPDSTPDALNATPVKSLDVPVSAYAPTTWTDLCNVRRGVAECCSAAVACSADGSTTGAYVLVAQRSDIMPSTSFTGWGYVALTGYRYWEDQYGLPHWDEVMSTVITNHKASQLRVWLSGANILVGFVADAGGGTPYSIELRKWAPRTSLTTVTATTLLAAQARAVNAWDVSAEGYIETSKTQYALVASLGVGGTAGADALKIWVLDEDNTTVHGPTSLDGTEAFSCVRCSVHWWIAGAVICVLKTWQTTDTPGNVYQTSVDFLTQHAVYSSTVELINGGDLSDDIPTVVTCAVAPEYSTRLRVWMVYELTHSGGTLGYHGYWWELSTGGIYATDSMGLPGRLASKPFAWGNQQAAWCMTGNEDTTDRSWVCVRLKPILAAGEQCAPVAIASPNQAGFVATTTLLSGVSAVACPGPLGTPDRWFWAAGETYVGASNASIPDVAPRVHCWGTMDILPQPIVVDGSQVFSCEGVPAVWGPSGRQELQPVMGPGLLHFEEASSGTGLLQNGTYSWRAVWRMVRPDGTIVRSKPGPSCSGTVTGGYGHGIIWIRPPKCTCVPAESVILYCDIYRTTADVGTIWYYVGSATIQPSGTYYEYEFHDPFSDDTIAAGETLYTHATDDIPCAGIPSFSTMRAHNGRIFGAHGRRLWYSTQRASNVGPYFPAGAYLECEDNITALASTEMGLVVFTRSSTWLLYGDGPGPNLQPFWSPLRLLSRDVGCVSQCSVHEWRDGTVFQSDRGIELLTKGGQIQLHSGQVQEQIRDYPIVRRVLESKDDQELRFLCATAGAWPSDHDTAGCLARWLVWNYGGNQWRTEEAMGMFDAATVVDTSGEDLFEVRRHGANITPGWQCWRALGWYDQAVNQDTTASTYSYPVRSLRTGTIRPGGLGGWGRLRRLRLYGDPATVNSGITGNQVTITVRQHSEVDAAVSSAHAVQVHAPLYGATAENLLIEIAPTNQLCSEFEVQVEEDVPDSTAGVTGSLFVQCGCSDTSNHALTGLGVVDGVTLVEGVTVVALLGQSDGRQNGAWVAKNAGWTRATTLPAGTTAESLTLKVTAGTARANTFWFCTASPSTVGTNSLTYVQVNSTTDGLAGEGTAWTGLEFDWEDLANKPRTTSLMRA